MLIILMVYQRVANTADAPLAEAPEGGEVNRNFSLLSQTPKEIQGVAANEAKSRHGFM
jgi:hypothetical protein